MNGLHANHMQNTCAPVSCTRSTGMLCRSNAVRFFTALRFYYYYYLYYYCCAASV